VLHRAIYDALTATAQSANVPTRDFDLPIYHDSYMQISFSEQIRCLIINESFNYKPVNAEVKLSRPWILLIATRITIARNWEISRGKIKSETFRLLFTI